MKHERHIESASERETSRRPRTRTLVLAERVLVFALLEQLISDLPDRTCDLERSFGTREIVLAINRVLVLRVVFVHIPICRSRLGQGRVVRGDLSTVRDNTGFDRDVTARGLSVLYRTHDGLAAEHLAEDNVLVIEVGRGVAGDEELRAVRVRAGVGLLRCSTTEGGRRANVRTMERRKRFECFTSKFSSSNFSP